DLPIRVGSHFGECSQFTDGDAWAGRAINLAKRVESNALPDSLFVTQTVLELIDLPFYDYAEIGDFELKGDFVPSRPIYHLKAVDHIALSQRPESDMTAEDWFLMALGSVIERAPTQDEEARFYEKALQLRPHYPE